MSITRAIFHDGLLVAKVVGRPAAVRAELRRERTSVKQIVDRHLDEPRDAHRQARRDAASPAHDLPQRVGLAVEGGGDRHPSASPYTEVAQRRAHVTLLRFEQISPHAACFNTTGVDRLPMTSFAMPCSVTAWTMHVRLCRSTLASTSFVRAVA